MIDFILSWAPWIGVFSFLMFLSALVSLPPIISRLPVNFFLSHPDLRHRPPLLQILIVIIKNLLGLFLVLMGFIMLFIPGQGLLTILAGLILMNFPGKKYLIHRLLKIKSLQRGLNLIRRRKGREDFIFPEEPGDP
jgi:hypothetical protein